MILPNTEDELEELIYDLHRQLDDEPLMDGNIRQALRVQLNKAATRLFNLRAGIRLDEPDPLTSPGRKARITPDQEAALRAWAIERGWDVPDAGPLPLPLWQAYVAAGNPAQQEQPPPP